MTPAFFETFKLLNGQVCQQEFHLERIRRTQKAFFENADFDMRAVYSALKDYPEGLFKVRVDYSTTISQVKITLYDILAHRRIALTDAGDFSYPFKYADRRFFEQRMAEHPDCDDVLFVKEGCLTDTTYCNVALLREGQWFTPSTYLLPGTKRAALLQNGTITEAMIGPKDLENYEALAFINAMRDFERKYAFVMEGASLLLKELLPD